MRGVRPRGGAGAGGRGPGPPPGGVGGGGVGGGDGRIWEVVPDGCRAGLACEQDQRVPAGAALGVAVTYSASFAVDTTFGADDELIGTPLTATAAFTNAPGASIAISATQ